jgi:hypothetical protein
MTVEVMELFFALAGVVDLLDHDMSNQTLPISRIHHGAIHVKRSFAGERGHTESAASFRL